MVAIDTRQQHDKHKEVIMKNRGDQPGNICRCGRQPFGLSLGNGLVVVLEDGYER